MFHFASNRGAPSSVLSEILWFWLSVFIVVSVSKLCSKTIVRTTLGIIFDECICVSVCCGMQAVTSAPQRFKTAQSEKKLSDVWLTADSYILKMAKFALSVHFRLSDDPHFSEPNVKEKKGCT